MPFFTSNRLRILSAVISNKYMLWRNAVTDYNSYTLQDGRSYQDLAVMRHRYVVVILFKTTSQSTIEPFSSIANIKHQTFFELSQDFRISSSTHVVMSALSWIILIIYMWSSSWILADSHAKVSSLSKPGTLKSGQVDIAQNICTVTGKNKKA